MTVVCSRAWSPKDLPHPARANVLQPSVPNIRQQVRPPEAPATGKRPTCIIPGCQNPVIADFRTKELTEYCGEPHMQFVVSS